MELSARTPKVINIDAEIRVNLCRDICSSWDPKPVRAGRAATLLTGRAVSTSLNILASDAMSLAIELLEKRAIRVSNPQIMPYRGDDIDASSDRWCFVGSRARLCQAPWVPEKISQAARASIAENVARRTASR